MTSDELWMLLAAAVNVLQIAQEASDSATFQFQIYYLFWDDTADYDDDNSMKIGIQAEQKQRC